MSTDDRRGGASRPDDRRGGASRPDDRRGGASRPDDRRGGASRPEDRRGGASRPDDRRGGASRPDDRRGGASRPEDRRGGASRPEDRRGGASRPEDRRGEASLPDDERGDGRRSDDTRGGDGRRTDDKRARDNRGTDEPEGQRLQKVLAQAGLASRRASEIMIDRGRVEVNGQVVSEQGRRVDPEHDVIRVDGSRIPPPRRHRYIVLNKPRGVVSTLYDPEGRPTLADAVVESGASHALLKERLFHVGRLDTDTEGLIILTNDGDFGHRLSHPSFEIDKTYLVEVEGLINAVTLKRLKDGIELDDGPVRPRGLKIVSTVGGKSLVRLTLHEGRNHIVRRTMEHVGHPVRQLSRIGIGPVRLGTLKVGQIRDLTSEELGALLDLVDRA